MLTRQMCPYNGKLGGVDPKKIAFLDQTLREGEQASGVFFTLEEKKEYIRRVDDLGVQYIEFGTYDFSERVTEELRAMCALNTKAKKRVQVRANSDEVYKAIDAVADMGADYICPMFFFTKGAFDGNGSTDLDWQLKRAADAVSYIKRKGLIAGGGLIDSTRMSREGLSLLTKTVVDAGIDIIGVPDSAGVASPEGMYETISMVREITEPAGVTICGHTHNDFGVALANMLAAVRAGAEMISCTMNGLGDRAGNAALEEVIVALEALYGYDLGIDMKKLIPLSKYTEEISGRKMPGWKPITGKFVYCDEREPHVLASARTPFAYSGILPEELGTKRSVLFGRHTRPAIISLVAREAGRVIEEKYYDEIQRRLYDLNAAAKGTVLDENDFWTVVDAVTAEGEGK